MRIPQRGCGSPGLKVTPLWGWGKHPVGPGCGWRKEKSSGSICYQISGQERDVNSWYKWKKPHIQIPWCSWGTSTFISAGSAHTGTTTQEVCGRHFSWWRQMLCWTSHFQTRRNCRARWKLGAADAAHTMRWWSSGSQEEIWQKRE